MHDTQHDLQAVADMIKRGELNAPHISLEQKVGSLVIASLLKNSLPRGKITDFVIQSLPQCESGTQLHSEQKEVHELVDRWLTRFAEKQWTVSLTNGTYNIRSYALNEDKIDLLCNAMPHPDIWLLQQLTETFPMRERNSLINGATASCAR